MKTILIIVAFAGSLDGGVSAHSVEFGSMEACARAAAVISRQQQGNNGGNTSHKRLSVVYATCHPSN